MNPLVKFIDAKGLGKKAAKKTLTKAERDENLKKFLEPSVVKERMFHGSTNPDIVQFKTGKTLLEERYPQIKVKPFEHSQGRDAAFLTPDPQFASRYSGEEWAVTPGTAPTVYPVRVQAQNPWDYDNPEHIEAAINLYKEKFPLIRDSSGAVPSFDANRHRYLEEVLRELPSRNDNWSGIERPDIQEVIRDLGHDSFFVKERGVKNLGVYDPKKIKSDLGNQGTYDVTDPDINKAEGGLIRMQDGGGEIKASPQNKYIGAVADALKAAQGFAGKYQVDPRIPLLGGMGVDELLGLPGAESLVRDVSYYGPKAVIKGGNVATGGLGTYTLDPRVVDVAGVAETGALAAQAAKGAGRAIGRQLQQQITQTPMQSQMGAVNITAPVSKLGFYNPIEEMATTLQRKQGPGQAFLNEFTKAGISKQRLEDAGLAQKLATAPNVTREEVQAMTKGTMPDVEEVVLSRSVVPPYMKGFANLYMPDLNVNDYRQIIQLRKLADERYQKALAENDLDAAEFAMKAEEDINKFSRTHSYGTKPGERLTEYHEYQEPGGKNYREVLLKVPSSEKYDDNFRSSHWSDPNVISHIRMNDRVDADNKNVLFIEELQSDWAQEGRKKGFAPKDFNKQISEGEKRLEVLRDQLADIKSKLDQPGLSPDERNNLMGEFIRLETKQMDEIDWGNRLYDARSSGVPEGPFIKNTNEWVDLSLKNIIKRAVDEGYDRVAFIDGYKSFLRFPQGADGKSTEAGMRKFYDEVVPSRLKALVGKDNVRTIPGITQQPQLDVSLHGNRYFVVDADTDIPLPNQDGFRSVERAEQYLDEVLDKTKSMDQIGFDITPEIREKFSAPIPYKHGGVVKMKNGGVSKLRGYGEGKQDVQQFMNAVAESPIGRLASAAGEFGEGYMSGAGGTDLQKIGQAMSTLPILGIPATVAKTAKAAKAGKRTAEQLEKLKTFVDPQSTKIQEWQWRPLAEIDAKLNLASIPDYIQKGYGEFMLEQAKRAASGNLGVRDLIKAYGITQSSIGRGGLSHSTATKAGLKVPKTDELVRPEGAFAEWLGSKQGQRFLDDAERGVVNEKALDDIRTKFAPFGKANQLTEQLRYGVNNMSTLVPQMQKALVGSADEYRDWAESIKGIAGAKSGFIGSMLGRGDLPTLDARQLNLHALEAPVAPQTMMQRGKGLGAREAVDRLAARQSALGLDIDPSLDPYYQHLAHHAVWDKVADEKTTHDDLMRALRGYKQGGSPDTDAMRLEMMRKSWRSK